MRPLRFTIGGLMGLVLIAGLGVAALRSPTSLWDRSLFTIVLIVLGAATLGAFLHRGRARAVWAGFASFGWAYLALVVGPGSDAIRPRLLTTWVLDELEERLHPDRVVSIFVSGSSGSGTPTRLSLANSTTSILANNVLIRTSSGKPILLDSMAFGPIGHSLAAMLAAALGGALGGALFGAAERRREDETRREQIRRIESAPLRVSHLAADPAPDAGEGPLSG